jgi:L-asparaginase
MREILIINTGGTFNKIYDHIGGELEVESASKALVEISVKWQCSFEIINIIGKDSLDMDDSDRSQLLNTINLTKIRDIIIVHGTDTMEITAKYLADAKLHHNIVLTGAMVPYSVDPVEATANLAMAYGYIQNIQDSGVYISMGGIVDKYENITKDRVLGRFVKIEDV